MAVTEPICFFNNYFGLQRLCDNDPGVMGSTLCPLYDLISEDVNSYKDLVVSFVSILKQVAERRLPKSYDYHQMPAPFIQVCLSKFQFDLLHDMYLNFLCKSLKAGNVVFLCVLSSCEVLSNSGEAIQVHATILLSEGWISNLAEPLKFKSFHPITNN